MKPIQEKITNETAYRNHLHKLNEENVKLKKEVRKLKNALIKAENLSILDFSKCTCEYDCDNCGAKKVKPISMGSECCPKCFC